MYATDRRQTKASLNASALGVGIINSDGDDSSLQADSQPKSGAWSNGRRPLGASACMHQVNQVKSRKPCGHDDSIINMVPGIIISILLSLLKMSWFWS